MLIVSTRHHQKFYTTAITKLSMWLTSRLKTMVLRMINTRDAASRQFEL